MNTDKPTKTKASRILTAVGDVALHAAREFVASAGRDVVDRVAHAAYSDEEPSVSWSELPENKRDVWRRRVGSVLRAAALEVKKLNGE